jgi:hypothetical protein
MTDDEAGQARRNLRWAVDAGELNEADYERRVAALDRDMS